MIVRDEQENLRQLLPLLQSSGVEWVVVDTGSVDGTLDLLRASECRLVERPWDDDFAAARNAGLETATRRFILWLDADDRPDANFFAEVGRLAELPSAAWRFLVRSPTPGGDAELFRQIRLFPNRPELRFRGRIHEEVASSCERAGVPIQDAAAELLHQGYADPAERSRKSRRNLLLLEREAQEHPDDPHVLLQWGNALWQVGHLTAALEAYRGGMALPAQLRSGEAARALPTLMGRVLEELGHKFEAEAAYREGMREAPQLLQGPYRLARLLLHRGEWRQALELFMGLVEHRDGPGLLSEPVEAMQANSAAFAGLILLQSGRAREAWNYLLRARDSGLPLPLDPWVLVECAGLVGEPEEGRRMVARYGLQADDAQKQGWLDRLAARTLSTGPSAVPPAGPVDRLRWESAFAELTRAPSPGALEELAYCCKALGNVRFTLERLRQLLPQGEEWVLKLAARAPLPD